MMYLWNPMYLLAIAPALLLGFWAQMKVRSTYAKASQMAARLSGAAAARACAEAVALVCATSSSLAAAEVDSSRSCGTASASGSFASGVAWPREEGVAVDRP